MKRFCSALALTAALAGCASTTPKPRPAPEPPVIRCELGPTADPEDPPADWLRDGPEWAARLLGGWREERRLRALERDCLARARREGLIR